MKTYRVTVYRFGKIFAECTTTRKTAAEAVDYVKRMLRAKRFDFDSITVKEA